MDSITHLFLGGAIAAVMAPVAHRRRALLAGALINSLPDIDVLPLFLLSDDPLVQLTWHRAATHSLLVLPWVAMVTWSTSFIIDPLFTLPLVIACVAAWARARKPGAGQRGLMFGLAFAGAYPIFGGASGLPRPLPRSCHEH